MDLELTNSCTPGRRRWHLALGVNLWQSGALPGPGLMLTRPRSGHPVPAKRVCSPLLPLGSGAARVGGAGAVGSWASRRSRRPVGLPGSTDTAERSLAVPKCPFSVCSLLCLHSVVCPLQHEVVLRLSGREPASPLWSLAYSSARVSCGHQLQPCVECKPREEPRSALDVLLRGSVVPLCRVWSSRWCRGSVVVVRWRLDARPASSCLSDSVGSVRLV